MAVGSSRLSDNKVHHGQDGEDKHHRKDDAGENKPAGIPFFEVLCPIFVTLHAEGCCQNALQDLFKFRSHRCAHIRYMDILFLYMRNASVRIFLQDFCYPNGVRRRNSWSPSPNQHVFI